MLEGTAGRLRAITSVAYDGSVNALLLNDELVYFVKIPPWTLATLCREIATDRNMLVGVSETMTEGLVFGADPKIYLGSDLAYDLMLADKFLGDLVSARPKGWTEGYKFPDSHTPVGARVKSSMLVRFAFGNFEFAESDGVLSAVKSSLEVRLMPVSNVASPNGQMLPDYNKLEKGYTPPAAFSENVEILKANVEYFRREPLIEEVFADGETAAILRSLKESGLDVNALAGEVESGGTK